MAQVFPSPPLRTPFGPINGKPVGKSPDPVKPSWPWSKWFQQVSQQLSTPLNWDAPASSASPGQVGQVAIDENYLYICVAVNTWKRVALTVF